MRCHCLSLKGESALWVKSPTTLSNGAYVVVESDSLLSREAASEMALAVFSSMSASNEMIAASFLS